ncbi:MAG: hypothetical protein M0009_15785 [Deltaproteobacteria bacterium]|nr:hypothetical protein [Deltaproteobacteria bacterium]
MDDPVWDVLEDLPGEAAALFDWNLRLGAWPRYEAFKSRFFRLTRDHASAVDCPTDCGLGCPRKVIEHSPADIVAICQEREAEPVQLSTQDLRIYKIDHPRFNEEICTAFGIEHRASKVDGCSHTWRLGDFTPAAGMVFPVFFTRPDEGDGLSEVARTLCIAQENSFALIAPTRRRLNPVAEGLLARRKALFLSLKEEIAISEDGGLNRIQAGPSFKSLMPAGFYASPADPLPKNIFRRSGDRWQIRFNGGEPISLGRQKGFEYLTALLESPQRYISVLDLYHGGKMDEDARRALQAGGLDIGSYREAAELRSELLEIDKDIGDAERCHDFGRLESLQKKRDALTSHLKSMIGPGGRLRKANDPLKKPRDSVSKAVGRAVKSIRDAGMTGLADHLEKSLESGGEMSYRPVANVLWETKPMTG